jgi:hypothetical protein
MAVNVADTKEIIRKKVSVEESSTLDLPEKSKTITTILSGIHDPAHWMKRNLWIDPEFHIIDIGFGRILHAKLPTNSAIITRSASVFGMMSNVSGHQSNKVFLRRALS